MGGEVRFLNQVTDFMTDREQEEFRRIKAPAINGSQVLTVKTVALAIGYSIKDISETLLARGIPIESEAFAMGLRVQHPQALINENQCDIEECGELGPTSYRLIWKPFDERRVYSFCVRSGGYMVSASSEPGRLTVNGMSYHDRAGENINSAIIVTATSEDFGGVEAESRVETESGTERGCEAPRDTVTGIRFQRRLEEAALYLGKGSIPVQFYRDSRIDRVPDGLSGVNPVLRGGCAFANLRELLPEPLSRVFMEGMEGLGTMIRGFDRPDAILADIESRTSSLVRILRDQRMESLTKGIFSCSEGAGYAGGITSAAMDGIKTAKEIIRRCGPLSPSQGMSGEGVSTTQKLA